MATSAKTTAATKTARKPPARKAATPKAPTPVRVQVDKPATPTPKAAPTAQVPKAKTGKPLKADKPGKEGDKVKKPKLVRDSFTIPKAEYEVIAALKLRAARLGQTPKKSELLRAGIKLLAGLNDQALLTSLAAVPSIKTGRPAA